MIDPDRGFIHFFLGDGPEVAAEKGEGSGKHHQTSVDIYNHFQHRKGVVKDNKCNYECGQQIYCNVFNPQHKKVKRGEEKRHRVVPCR